MNHNKKMIIVGEWCWPWYQEACARYIRKENWDVIEFGWNNYFRKYIKQGSDVKYKSMYHKIEYYFQQGPLSLYLNYKLLNTVKKEKPNVIWFYNSLLITTKTIKKIKYNFPDIKLIQYSNDDPFSENIKKFYWRHYLSSVKLYDYHFCYRERNINDYKKLGIHNAKLLRSYFIPEDDYYLNKNTIEEKFICDVVFAGHYENDGRIDILRSIVNKGFKLNLYGGGWNKILQSLKTDDPLKKYFPVYPAIGINYRKAICGSKVSLCFHSKINNDTYTRRNFQLPAMQSAVLSEFSNDLKNFFIENEEILLFKSEKECLEKLESLIKNRNFRLSLGKKSYERVVNDGHDIASRMKEFLKNIE